MSRLTRVAVALAAGSVGILICFVPIAAVALGGAALVLIVLPAWAAALALTGGDAHADRADVLAASFGGIAASSAAVWIGGATLGLSRAVIFAAPICASVVLVLTARPSVGPRTSRSSPYGFRTLLLLAVVFAVLVAIPFLPHGRVRPDGVHRMGLGDWYLHLMMTNSLDAADSLPPPNPYLFAHKRAHYHYGFHLLAAALHRAAGRQGDIFPILLGLTTFTAAAFPLVLFAVARRRLGGDARKALVAAIAGVLLAGFDLVVWVTYTAQNLLESWPLPRAVESLRGLVPSVHLNSWVPIYEREFNPPYLALLWAPHYGAAVLTSLLCLHALRSEVDRPPVFVVALLLAALPGLSGYVALAMGVAVIVLVAVDQWRTGWPPRRSGVTWRWLGAGIGAVVLAWPILATLRASLSQHVTPLVLHVSSAGTIRNGAIFTFFFGDHQWTRLVDTPALSLFQFGIIGVLGVIGIVRRLRNGKWTELTREHAAIVVVLFAFLILFRPPVGMDNNLGFRPMLLVWSLLVPFAVEAWYASTRSSLARWVSVALCAAAIPYAVVGETLEGWLFRPTPPAWLALSRWIDENVPPGAVVAIDPENHPRAFDYWLRRPLIWADHQRNAFMLGAPPEEYDAIRRSLHEAYVSPVGADAARRFLDLGTDVVVVEIGPQSAPRWRGLPCFRLGYGNAQFAALIRTNEACRPPSAPMTLQR